MNRNKLSRLLLPVIAVGFLQSGLIAPSGQDIFTGKWPEIPVTPNISAGDEKNGDVPVVPGLTGGGSTGDVVIISG